MIQREKKKDGLLPHTGLLGEKKKTRETTQTHKWKAARFQSQNVVAE